MKALLTSSKSYYYLFILNKYNSGNMWKLYKNDGDCFKYLRSKFPNLSCAKVKEGIFIGPGVKNLMKAEEFIETIRCNEKNSWFSFKEVVKKQPNCRKQSRS